MAISIIELLAVLAWIAGLGAAVWGLRAGRVAAPEGVLLLLVLTLIPLLGPVAVALFVWMRPGPDAANASGSP